MKTIRYFVLALVLGGLSLSSAVRAEDIDIYSGSSGANGLPNVLLVLDNAANFSSSAASCTFVDDGTPGGITPSLNGTAGGIEQCAIYNVVHGLAADSVNLGLMVYNATNIRDINNANCGGADGGCLVQPLVNMTGVAKDNFLAWVKTWNTSGGTGNGYIKATGEATAASMQEAWAYYAGSTGLSGRSYAGVKPTAGCQKNFVIFIGNAFTNAGTPGDTGNVSPSGALAAAPGFSALNLTPDPIPLSPGPYGSCGNFTMSGNWHQDSSGLYADEWARYMYKTDLYSTYDDSQVITTYTIGLLGASCKSDYPALLTSMAAEGGGQYFATSSYDEISTAIEKILNDIQAVNSVFSSASLPVSVNAQGTYLNQIFMGMFRPDASANPRWVGNLKQYQFTLTGSNPSTATLQLADSTGAAALNAAGTGFFSPNAISFWTSKDEASAPDSTGGFFVNDPNGSGLAFDSPDGELVEKGGVAQQIRKSNLTVNYASTPSSPRRLYTYCPSGTCDADLTKSVNAFATSNALITDALLGSAAGITLSITRLGTTATATATSHGFIVGDVITISGSTQVEYNGIKTITAKTTDTFSFTVPEYPVTPATGSFTASIPGVPQALTAGAITRSGTTATVNLLGHGFVTNQTVTISGAAQSEYNGSKDVSVIDGNSFTFNVVEGPVTPAGQGTATVGAKSQTIAAYNANPNPGVTRSGTTITVTTTTNHGFSNGNTVTLAGVKDSTGSLISAYNIAGTVSGVSNSDKKSFTLVGSTSTTPATPATEAVSGTPITADGSSVPKSITGLSRSGTTVTATSAGHGFVNGQTVNIGGTAGTNESGYVGSYVISNVTTDTFQYSIVTTPTSAAGTAAKSGTGDRTTLINWVRGEDNYGDEASPGSGYNVRTSIHGDVLHSRPVVINYGDSRGLVVYYGANDGVFRAVNGSQTDAIDGVDPGNELWGLVLPEHFDKLNRQRLNTPELKLSTTVLSSAQPKDYFVDGSVGVYQKLCGGSETTGDCFGKPANSIDKAYLYLTMRRGGRFIYALDVSEPTAPKFMWKINAGDVGFQELGQTWSRPRLTLVKGYSETVGSNTVYKPVLVFGGGYDPAEDAEPPTANTMGRGIFVVDAVTGARVWSVRQPIGNAIGFNCEYYGPSTAMLCSDMKWAIPSDITFVDRNYDGLTDRFYVGDVGGNVWRVDLEPTGSGGGITPDKWKTTKLAAVGCATGTCASGVTPRKFFYPPSVVSVGVTGVSGSYDVVMLGSGDREHPLKPLGTVPATSSFAVTNRYYVLNDTYTGFDAGTSTIQENGTGSAGLFNAGLVTGTTNTYDGTLGGFYLTFDEGEKAVNASVTVRGTTYFGTNKPTPPSATSCRSNLGEAKGYALDPFKGSFGATIFDGGGLPPSPTTGIITILFRKPGDKTDTPVKKEFCVGCGGGGAGTGADSKSSLGAVDPAQKVPKHLQRSYWYKR